MTYNVFPYATTSLLKSVQRGVTAGSSSVTISSVNISKSFVRSFSNGSSGSAGTNSSTIGTYNPSGGNFSVSSTTSNPGTGSFPTYSGTRTFTGGNTTLTSASYGAYLANSTTLVVDGACYWEVVEFN